MSGSTVDIDDRVFLLPWRELAGCIERQSIAEYGHARKDSEGPSIEEHVDGDDAEMEVVARVGVCWCIGVKGDQRALMIMADQF